MIYFLYLYFKINAYVAEVKNYEDPVALVMTKQFLENCIRVIKTKKVNNEVILWFFFFEAALCLMGPYYAQS